MSEKRFTKKAVLALLRDRQASERAVGHVHARSGESRGEMACARTDRILGVLTKQIEEMKS